MANINYITLIFFLTSILGCGNNYSNNPFPMDYDVSGTTGLRVKYPPTDPNYLPPLDFPDIEKIYIDTMQCAGIQAAGPLVIIVPGTLTSTDGIEANGIYWEKTGVIQIALINSNSAFFSVWTYRHEFIHYLLESSGFPPDQNHNHASDLFIRCVYY